MREDAWGRATKGICSLITVQGKAQCEKGSFLLYRSCYYCAPCAQFSVVRAVLSGCSLSSAPRSRVDVTRTTGERGFLYVYVIFLTHPAGLTKQLLDRRRLKGGSLVYRTQFRYGTTCQDELLGTYLWVRMLNPFRSSWLPKFGHPAGSARTPSSLPEGMRSEMILGGGSSQELQ